MEVVGLLLLALGVADAARWQPDAPVRRQVAALGAAAAPVLGLLLLADLTAGEVAGWAAGLLAVTAAWLLTSAGALRTGRGGPVPLAVLAASVVAALATTGPAPAFGGALLRWYDGLDVPALGSVPLASALVAVGALAVVQVTGNVVVRLVLLSAGSTPPAVEGALRGGRVLGPLERTLLLALTLGGELTAAAVVVAAKGLLRFPEIQRSRAGGVDALTEYFLIGSLTSWLLALALVPLV